MKSVRKVGAVVGQLWILGTAVCARDGLEDFLASGDGDAAAGAWAPADGAPFLLGEIVP